MKCTICEKIFSSSSNIRTHISNKHKDVIVTGKMKEYYVKVEGENNKPFNCEICQKDFDMKRDLKEHLARIHCNKSPDEKTIEWYDWL